NADAHAMNQVLGSILQGNGLRIVADQRTNSIIATGNEADLVILEALLNRLDEPGDRKETGRTTMAGPGGRGPGAMMAATGSGPTTAASSAPITTPPAGPGPGIGGPTALPKTLAPSGVGAGPNMPMAGGPSGIGTGKGSTMSGAADIDQRFKALD